MQRMCATPFHLEQKENILMFLSYLKDAALSHPIAWIASQSPQFLWLLVAMCPMQIHQKIHSTHH
jgi:hypothetical protein